MYLEVCTRSYTINMNKSDSLQHIYDAFRAEWSTAWVDNCDIGRLVRSLSARLVGVLNEWLLHAETTKAHLCDITGIPHRQLLLQLGFAYLFAFHHHQLTAIIGSNWRDNVQQIEIDNTSTTWPVSECESVSRYTETRTTSSSFFSAATFPNPKYPDKDSVWFVHVHSCSIKVNCAGNFKTLYINGL